MGSGGMLFFQSPGNFKTLHLMLGCQDLLALNSYRINWEDPEYASMGKQGVANRATLERELNCEKRRNSVLGWRSCKILLPLEAISLPAALSYSC